MDRENGDMAAKQFLKILTIGNSFTDCLACCFPDVVASAGCGLLWDRASHSGCELHRHWSYIEFEERDPAARLYQEPRVKLRDILRRESWDIVTIQQGGRESWRQELYQPYASNIYAHIRKYAPQAEVVIQQTWAYRADDPHLMPGSPWGFDQEGHFERLTAAYRKLASELGLRIIPVGCAVQLARREQSVPFQNYDPALLAELHWPDLPPQAGSLVGRIWWQKDENGRMRMLRDTIHLNVRGQYLQACVWFAFLYGRPVSEIKFVPDGIADADAAFLRGIAQRAVDEFEQVGIRRTGEDETRCSEAKRQD